MRLLFRSNRPRRQTAGQGGVTRSPSGMCRLETTRVSQVPRQPFCPFALFYDPGRTLPIGPLHRLGTAPVMSTTKATHDKQNFGAQSHGFRTGCLRFARWVAPQDARLASGCWPSSSGRDWLPAELHGRFPCFRMFLLPEASPGARTSMFFIDTISWHKSAIKKHECPLYFPPPRRA